MILVLDQSYGGEYLHNASQLSCKVDSSKLNDFTQFKFYVLNGCWSGTYKEGDIDIEYSDNTRDKQPPFKVRLFIPQSYLDHNQYIKNYDLNDQYEVTIDLIDNTIEKYRNDVINAIGKNYWYRVIELEDELNLKYADEDNINPKIVEILNRGVGGIDAYRKMMHFRNQRFQIHNMKIGYINEK